MNASFRPWALYVLCLFLGFGSMGWITRTALRTERAEMEAQQKAVLEEKVHLALLRMDSTMSLFLLPEASRPYYHYEAFHHADAAYPPQNARASSNEALMPSPMLLSEDALVLLRFQVDAHDRFSSPLVPSLERRSLAKSVVLDAERLSKAIGRLDLIRNTLTREAIHSSMAKQGAVLLSLEQIRDFRSRIPAGREPGSLTRFQLESPFKVFQGAWTPFWHGDLLILARQVWVGDQELLQCSWLDWDSVKGVLMSTIRDRFPHAELLPSPAGAATEKGRLLGSLPVRLLPGPLPDERSLHHLPARAALLFGWSCALLATIAGGLVLHWVLQLSERRRIFASAVTHELRTPMTTFRLYTELLAFDMVPDEHERRSLFKTLLSEVDRLDHLVKNVLAYARTESRRELNLEAMSLGELLDRARARLEDRARQSGADLKFEVGGEVSRVWLRTDALMLEQILFNLVDNACKYAAAAQDRSIHIAANLVAGSVQLHVKDHGPGVAPADRRHLFQPFHKSAEKAARSAPGVGLGLALCRRLAKGLGGDLMLDKTVADGACFVLRLPTV